MKPYKKLYETVKFSVNEGDYLFGDDKLIRIESIYWSIDDQKFFISIFDFETGTQEHIEFDLNEISIRNYTKINEVFIMVKGNRFKPN